MAVVAGDVALIVGSINNVRIRRERGDVAGLPAADVIPIGAVNGAIVTSTLDGDRSAILLRPIDAIRRSRICGDVVELRGGLIILLGPTLPAIERDRNTAVIGCDHAVSIERVNPQAVVVAMGN